MEITNHEVVVGTPQIIELSTNTPNFKQIESELISLNKRLNLEHFNPQDDSIPDAPHDRSPSPGDHNKSNQQAREHGYTIPYEYGPMNRRIELCAKHDSPRRMFVSLSGDNHVTGYCETVIYEADADTTGVRTSRANVSEEGKKALTGRHVEIREIATDPDASKSGFANPAFGLLRTAEDYAIENHIQYIMPWIIGHRGPDIPNKTSWNFFRAAGYEPAVTTNDSDVKDTVAVGLYKKLPV